ncbi:hypothetical protein CYPRO_1332 [Cyclonatronum proteinivorum]|uniref:Uncharacterized protein n=1 Tax=Cyclonatronum proteinivorum TaxID=1457365 RepID=A0A345UJD7_9BACT|nr:hypothetical protein CYPRO_1332 [Cyclonatronum proteinivorum]
MGKQSFGNYHKARNTMAIIKLEIEDLIHNHVANKESGLNDIMEFSLNTLIMPNVSTRSPR